MPRFGLCPCHERRVPHISLVSREMWDTSGLPLKPLSDSTTPHGYPTFAPEYVGRKRWAKPAKEFSFGPTAYSLGPEESWASGSRGDENGSCSATSHCACPRYGWASIPEPLQAKTDNPPRVPFVYIAWELRPRVCGAAAQ